MMTISLPPSTPPVGNPLPAAPSPPPPAAPARATHPFRALMLKELRENAIVLFLFWATVAVFLTVMWTADGFKYYRIRPFLLMQEDVLIASSISCACIGFICGFVPHRTTKRFDDWAFLTHRPLTRSRMFAYRSAIGLGLYLLTLLPLMGLFLFWAANSPVASPIFHWRFLLPYAADACLGVVTFFAGTIVAQRQASWLLTGMLPALGAVALLVATLGLTHFWQVLAVQAVVLALFVVTAHAGAVTHGEHTGRSLLPARAALVGTLFLGCLLPALAITAFGGAWLQQLWVAASGQIQEMYERPRFHAHPVYLKNDTLGIQISRASVDEASGRVTLRSLTGERLPPDLRVEHEFIMHPWINQTPQRNYRNLDSILTRDVSPPPVVPPAPEPATRLRWVYQPYERTYSAFLKTVWFRHRVWSLGPSGYREGSLPPEPFPDPLPHDPLLNRHRLYYFAPGSTELRSVDFPNEQLEKVEHLGEANKYAVVQTDKHWHVYQSLEKPPLAVIPRNSASGRWLRVVMLRNELGYIVQWFEATPTPTMKFQRVDSSGKPVASPLTYDLQRSQFSSTDVYLDLLPFTNYPYTSAAAGALAGLGMPVVFAAYTVAMNHDTRAFGLTDYLEYLEHQRWFISGILIVNLIACLTMIRLTRRYHLTRRASVAWSLATLLLGPWTLILFVGSHPLPPRVICPACGKPRPASADPCPHCRAPAATPALNGTEIFA